MVPPPMYAVSANPMQTMALRLPINTTPNDDVPYELQQYYSRDVWVARQRAVLTKGSRYLKPRLEIIFAVFMFLASIAVPIVTYYLILNALPKDNTEVTDDRGRVFVNDPRFWQARAAGMGALIGLLLLGWGPFFLWKANGRRQVNQMLARFSVEDAAVKGSQVPSWQMKMPGVGSKALHIFITYPRTPMVTPFQMGATLPPYLVNQPIDPNVPGYFNAYPAPGHAQGAPHHPPANNGVGGVPLYNDYDEKIPEYSAPTNGTYLPNDEKDRFDDIKV